MSFDLNYLRTGEIVDDFDSMLLQKLEITFLPGNNYPDSHHSHGGMKFATQISTLLNIILYFSKKGNFNQLSASWHMTSLRADVNKQLLMCWFSFLFTSVVSEKNSQFGKAPPLKFIFWQNFFFIRHTPLKVISFVKNITSKMALLQHKKNQT